MTGTSNNIFKQISQWFGICAIHVSQAGSKPPCLLNIFKHPKQRIAGSHLIRGVSFGFLFFPSY